MSSHILESHVLSGDDFAYVSQFIPKTEPELKISDETLYVCEPKMSARERLYVTDTLRHNLVSSMGHYVQKFEKAFAAYCGAAHAITVTNGTHAVHLALASLGVGPGDEVIVPNFTMIAVANSVTYLGAKPIFVDVRRDTWNLDENLIESAITKRTKAIVVVHTYGHPAEMDTIMEIAQKYNLAVVEDAAEAHGAEYKGRKVGTFGDVGCFSLYANKMITSGEGGIVVTNRDDLARVLFKLHNHAFSDTIHFWHEYLGFNYRMTSLQAAVGLAQLEKIEKFITARRNNAHQYSRALSKLPGISLPVELPQVRNTYWMFGFVVDEHGNVSRDQLREALAAQGIETRTFFIPLSHQPIYFNPTYKNRFPVSEWLSKNGLYLPSASHLNRKAVARVSQAVVAITTGT